MTASVAIYDFFEASFSGPSTGNPFLEVSFDAVFSQHSREVRVPGFYDGEGTYRVRFMPDTPGEWTFKTRSKTAALDGSTGTFTAVAPRQGMHGPVAVANKFHFAHADGTPYFPFGTTCYAWTHQPLADAGRNAGNPGQGAVQQAAHGRVSQGLSVQHQRAAAARLRAEGRWQLRLSTGRTPRPSGISKPQVGRLRDMGIEADIIIFHPYDRWGYLRHDRGAGFPLRRLSGGAARGLFQRLVVARQRVRLPARHQAHGAVGSLLPHPRRERPVRAPEVDPQWRPVDELRPSQGLGQPCLHPALGREAHA